MIAKCIAGILLIVNIFLAVTILWGGQGLRPYRQQQAVLEDLQSKLRQVRQENVDLSNKIRLLKKDRFYLEQVVRSKLHYVQANEVIYLDH